MTVLRAISIPSVACGLTCAACAFLLAGGNAAAWALGSVVAASVAIGMSVVRNEHNACAQLRRPELRSGRTAGAGVFRTILEESLDRLRRLEDEASRAAQSKTQLEARTQLAQRRMRFLQAALDHVDRPVLISDSRDRIQCDNAAARRLFGRAGRDDNGSAEPLSLDHLPQIAGFVKETRNREAAKDHRTTEFELNGDGQTMSYRATARVLHNKSGRFEGVVTVIDNINNERQEQTRHAEFVSSVCHELKTPMAGIRAYVEMLLDGDVTEPDEQQELYGFIELQVDRLTRMVNSMLNLARIESGVIQVHREDCELNDVLRKACSVAEPTAEEKQIRLVPQLSELYLAAHVDKDLFGQAIINLLSNAVKYTPSGGEVRLRSRMDENQAVIEVTDTGMGIPEDSLPHIFERFYRVTQNNKAAAGTGLGLALVHYIVTELHNGTIDVESAVDEGTTFRVTVPLGHRDGRLNRKQKKQETLVGSA